MLKKVIFKSLNNFGLLSFALLISAAFIFGAWATSVQAAKNVDAKKSIAGLVDINNATQKELEDIKGVGAATAKKIIAGRPYKSVNELSKAGLNLQAVAAIKPFITVGKVQAAPLTATADKATSEIKEKKGDAQKGVVTKASTADITKPVKEKKSGVKSAATKLAPGTKININTADKAALEVLPEIGPVKAQAIIDGRPYKSIEGIMKVKGIKQKIFDGIKDYLVI